MSKLREGSVITTKNFGDIVITKIMGFVLVVVKSYIVARVTVVFNQI